MRWFLSLIRANNDIHKVAVLGESGKRSPTGSPTTFPFYALSFSNFTFNTVVILFCLDVQGGRKGRRKEGRKQASKQAN